MWHDINRTLMVALPETLPWLADFKEGIDAADFINRIVEIRPRDFQKWFDMDGIRKTQDYMTRDRFGRGVNISVLFEGENLELGVQKLDGSWRVKRIPFDELRGAQ